MLSWALMFKLPAPSFRPAHSAKDAHTACPARRALFTSPVSSVPSGVCLSTVKSYFLHRRLRCGILHEGVPHETAAVIFRHEHSDAEVDAQDIRVIPTGERI